MANLGSKTQPSFYHLSIFCTAYQGSGEPGAYPGGLDAQGGGHAGRGANPSQGIIALKLTHPFTHYGQFGNASQFTMHVFGLWEENPEETPEAQREHANSTHTE